MTLRHLWATGWSSIAVGAALLMTQALLCADASAASPFTAAQTTTSSQPQGDRDAAGAGEGISPAEILSDTLGVDFNPYLHRILRTIYERWMSLIPDDARPPRRLSGETLIRFSILPDGKIGAMYLDGSTHDDALNRAAWSAITSAAAFPSLPEQFHGPDLEIRVRFKVNEQ